MADTARMDWCAINLDRVQTLSETKKYASVEIIWDVSENIQDVVCRNGKNLAEAFRKCVDAAMRKPTKNQ